MSSPLLRTGNKDNRSVTSAVRSRRGGGGGVTACTLVSGRGNAERWVLPSPAQLGRSGECVLDETPPSLSLGGHAEGLSQGSHGEDEGLSQRHF